MNPSRVEAAINNLEPRPQLYESLISLLKAPEQNAGVEVIAYRADIAPNRITLGPRVAFRSADR